MSEENIEQVAQPELNLETPAEVASGGSGNEFLQMIPEELRGEPSLSPIKDVPNLEKAYINAQRLIGTDKIPLPANPTDEDLDRIYGKLGRPADANGYDIAVDGHIVTEDVAKNFSDIAHKLRLNPEQASGIMQYYKSAVENSSQDFEQQNKETAEETQASLKKEWGKAYDQKIEQASKVAKDFASSDLLNMELSNGVKVGNHPDFIKAFAKIAEFRHSVTSEDSIKENATTFAMTPNDAQSEINAIMADKSHAYWDRKNVVGRQKAIQRMQELHEMVHGS